MPQPAERTPDFLKLMRQLADFGSSPYSAVNLETLIRLKTAAGRPKDFEPVAELKQILARRQTP